MSPNYHLQARVLLSLRPLRRPQCASAAAPTLSQCLGTQRLWSSLLGDAFFADQRCEGKLIPLQEIAYLSRSYVVLDDYLNDEQVSNSAFHQEWLAAIAERIRSRIEECWGDPSELERQVERSCRSFQALHAHSSKNPAEDAIHKCEPFFNPYGLDSLTPMPEVRHQRLSWLRTFFTICQLLDDLCDLEEDIGRKTNHNLVLYGISPSDWPRAVLSRAPITLAVLRGAISALKRSVNLIGSNHYFKTYHESALLFLGQKERTLANALGLPEVTQLGIDNWSFTSTHLNAIFERSSVCALDLSDIRPELLQAFHLGFRSLESIEVNDLEAE